MASSEQLSGQSLRVGEASEFTVTQACCSLAAAEAGWAVWPVARADWANYVDLGISSFTIMP